VLFPFSPATTNVAAAVVVLSASPLLAPSIDPNRFVFGGR
jgi:hypothetical protein